MIRDKILRPCLGVFLMLTIFHVDITGQVEENIARDSLKTDSANNALKMIIEKNDTSALVPIDDLSDIPFEKTTIKIEVDRNPFRAWWYSALLPGLGQVYNKKAWKVPIIYTIFMGSFYLINDNNIKYQKYKYAYAEYEVTKQAPAWAPNYSQDQLKSRKDYFRRNRDLGIIMGSIMYLMNIVDASVDANLMDFDISDDLSLAVEPELKHAIIPQKSTFGLKFVLSLK